MLKSVLKFVRLKILVTCYALIFLGSVANGQITLKTILAIFVIAAWYIHAASSNDYADRYIDEINLKNAKDRPLVTKDISYKQLWAIHFASGIAALLLASFYGSIAVIAMGGMLVMDYLYSFKPARISDRGIISQFVLAIGYVFYPFSLGYWSTSMSSGYAWLLALGVYLGFIGRLLLKDFRDVKGDKKHGKMTFLLRHGARTTCIVSGVFWFLALAVMGYALSFKLGITVILTLGFIQACMFLWTLASTPLISRQLEVVALIAKAANITIVAVLALLLCQEQAGLSEFEIEIIPVVLGITLLGLNFIRYKTLVISKP